MKHGSGTSLCHDREIAPGYSQRKTTLCMYHGSGASLHHDREVGPDYSQRKTT